MVRPALLRVRPQPGALPEAKPQELQHTLPLLLEALVLVMGAGMQGRSTCASSASGLPSVPACTDHVIAAVNLINVKINDVLKPP